MKPCARNRKRIAWLALGALEAPEAEQLRAHLHTCARCRSCFEELTKVTAAIRNAEPDASLTVPPSFHRRVATALRAEASRPFRAVLAESLRRLVLDPRVALPVAGALVATLVAVSALRLGPPVDRPAPSPVQAPAALHLTSDLAPTLANYQSVANRSLDQLDELLTRQGSKGLARAPVFTASALAMPNGPD